MGELKKLDKPDRAEKGESQAKATPKETAKKAEPAKDVAKKNEPAKKAVPAQGDKERGKNFAKSVLNEMKKVHWPTREEVITYTGVVLMAVIIVGAMIFVVDEALGFALSKIIR